MATSQIQDATLSGAARRGQEADPGPICRVRAAGPPLVGDSHLAAGRNASPAGGEEGPYLTVPFQCEHQVRIPTLQNKTDASEVSLPRKAAFSLPVRPLPGGREGIASAPEADGCPAVWNTSPSRVLLCR